MSESNSPTSFFHTEKCPADQLLWTIKERISRASTTENILAPISSRDEYIFRTNPNVDEDDASQISELSDPFEELGGNIISNAENNQKRRLSKLEADVLVMNSFPSAHMRIQAELIEDSGRSANSFFSPDIDIEITAGINTILDDSESDIEFFQQISSSIDQVGIKNYKEDKKKLEDKEKQRQKLKSKKSQDDQDIDSSSLLSGIWRMLDAASNEDGFPITQPGYNFFNDREKKFFVRPMEKKTWCQKEEVRKKCEEWLKNVNK